MELVQKNSAAEAVPLNKRVAQSGVCARRKAATLVESGLVRVNGIIVKDPGFRVTPQDVVGYQKRALVAERFIYIALNKPRRVLTTLADEEGRKTVMSLLPAGMGARVFPVGRLDKETTGLLLLTNDGALAQHMAHPRYTVHKAYHVTLDRPLPEEIMATIRRGIKLSDGMIRVDRIEYAHPTEQHQVTVVLHSGKNQIIKRIFKQFSFWVKKLDRSAYAGLNTKGLARGEWRHLTGYEVAGLRRMAKKQK
jgi:23S rRNA pseudouridine2605 synthase